MADKQAAPTVNDYDVLKRPLVTEKTARMAEGNWISFEVAKDATKVTIKKAVERLYKVKVERVNTLNQIGKTKRVKGKRVFRSDMKKAFIKLADGQSVDVGAGV